MSEPRWLSEAEQAAWRRLVTVVMKLPAGLESQLQRDAGISHFEYFVIALLSEASDRSLKLSTLAGRSNASLSRLSHVVTRLEKRGYVTRRPSADGTRSMQAVLTNAGYEKVVATAPGHVAAVRSLVFDGMTPEQIKDVERICGELLDRIER